MLINILGILHKQNILLRFVIILPCFIVSAKQLKVTDVSYTFPLHSVAISTCVQTFFKYLLSAY